MADRIKLEAYGEEGRSEPSRATEASDYTFVYNPDRIRKQIGTEWRVRHVGTSPYPRYRWRKRETLTVTLEGGMYANEIGDLEAAILFRILRDGIGLCFKILNAVSYGITATEYWVFNKPLDFTTSRKGKMDPSTQVFIPWVTYRLTGQLVYDKAKPP